MFLMGPMYVIQESLLNLNFLSTLVRVRTQEKMHNAGYKVKTSQGWHRQHKHLMIKNKTTKVVRLINSKGSKIKL